MAFIPIPRGISLCFDMVTAGQNWQVCITVQKPSGSISTTDLDNVANAGESFWDDHMNPFFATATTLRQIRATDQSVEAGQQSIITKNDPGTGAAGALPNNTALVNSLRTAKRGRSYRGRSYWSGLDTSFFGNAVDAPSTPVTNFLAIWATWQADIETAGYTWVVPSKQHNGVETNPAAVNEITAAVMDVHYDSQRRRLAGRGT